MVAAARTVALAAMAPPAARRTNGSKVGELCALLDDAGTAEFLSFAVESGALALRHRVAGVADRAKPAVVLEVWLAKDLRLSMQECREAAQANVDVMCGWFVEVLEERGGEGKGVPQGGPVASSAPEASGFAAMLESKYGSARELREHETCLLVLSAHEIIQIEPDTP